MTTPPRSATADRNPHVRQWVLVAAVLVVAGVIGLLGPKLTGKAGGTVPLDHDDSPMRMDTARAAPVSVLPVRDALVGHWPGGFSTDDVDGRFEIESVRGVEHLRGKVGLGFSLTDQSQIQLKPHAALRLPKFTASAWVNVAAKTRGGHLLSLQVGPATNCDLAIQGPFDAAKHGRVQLGIGAEVLLGKTAVHDGKWHHVAATFDGKIARLWIDGQLDAEASRSLRLPREARGVLRMASVDGQLDELALYERALTPAEVKREVRAGEWGLVRAWTGDEASPGKFEGTIGYEDGKFGFGYRFGGHGHVEIPQHPALHLDRFTLAAWVKISGDVPHHYAVFAKENHHCGAPWNHRNFYLGISPKFVFGDVGVTFFAPGARIGAKAPINDGKWHHIAASHDGNKTTVYVDGKSIAEGPMVTPPVDDRQELWLGGYGRASRPLHARMDLDDGAVFDRALTVEQIGSLASSVGDAR